MLSAEARHNPWPLLGWHAERGSAAHSAWRRPQRWLQRRRPRRETAHASAGRRDRIIDLGADEFTRGRPHPMIDPAVRTDKLRAALADASLAVILLDVVIGFGAHADPAGQIAPPSSVHGPIARTLSPPSPAPKPIRRCARARSPLCRPPACWSPRPTPAPPKWPWPWCSADAQATTTRCAGGAAGPAVRWRRRITRFLQQKRGSWRGHPSSG